MCFYSPITPNLPFMPPPPTVVTYFLEKKMICPHSKAPIIRVAAAESPELLSDHKANAVRWKAILFPCTFRVPCQSARSSPYPPTSHAWNMSSFLSLTTWKTYRTHKASPAGALISPRPFLESTVTTGMMGRSVTPMEDFCLMNHSMRWIIVFGMLVYKGQWVTIKHFVSYFTRKYIISYL